MSDPDLNSIEYWKDMYDGAELDVKDRDQRIRDLEAALEAAKAEVEKLKSGPFRDLSQYETLAAKKDDAADAQAIEAGRELGQRLFLQHRNDCNVHSPTLRPCSCGFETRLRTALLAAEKKLGDAMEAVDKVASRNAWLLEAATYVRNVCHPECRCNSAAFPCPSCRLRQAIEGPAAVRGDSTADEGVEG